MSFLQRIESMLPAFNVSDNGVLEQHKLIINVLKQQVVNLNNQLAKEKKDKENLSQQLIKVKNERDLLKSKIQQITQNNDSLLQTFSIFQRQLLKRDYRSVLTGITNNIENNKQAPFHIEVIRTIKSRMMNNMIEPIKIHSASKLAKLYSKTLQNSIVEEPQVQLYNQIVINKKNIKISKIKNYGRKKGFHENFRHIFWMKIIQDKLKINFRCYQSLLQRLRNNNQNRAPSNSLIELDLRRMDFKLQNQHTRKIHEAVKQLLQLFQLYRPDLGYVQGMSYLAWILLIRLQPYEAFVCFTNLILHDPFIYALYTFQADKIKQIVRFFEEYLMIKRPKLRKHMINLCVDSELFIIQWAYTFFSRTFTLRIISAIWDLWFCEGFNVFYRTVVSIFELLQSELLQKNDNDGILQCIRTHTFKLDQNELLHLIYKNKMQEELKLT